MGLNDYACNDLSYNYNNLNHTCRCDFFFSSRRRHTRWPRDWSSDVCSSDLGLLTAPLRARFGIDFRYDYYLADLLKDIVLRSGGILNVDVSEDGANEIARRSRGTPRIANRLLRRARDFAEVDGGGRVDRNVADRALNALDVDEFGLDDMDSRIVLTLMEKFGGGPTGLGSLGVSVGEDAGTIEEVYEPYLIQEGFMERPPRGRVATVRAYQHFGIARPATHGRLFE